MYEDYNLSDKIQDVFDFIQFEDETALIYPWALPAETLCKKTMLHKIANALPDYYDSDTIYETIDKIAGVNPVLERR